MSKITEWFKNYKQKQAELILGIKEEDFIKIIRKIENTIYESGKVAICGNGGSLSNSQHFICDLVKGVADKKGIAINGVALGSNPSLFTAYCNDYSYEDAFAKELDVYGILDSDDILIGISVSGNSPNVVRAFEQVKNYNVQTIAIVGNNGDNKLGKMADMVISFDSRHFGRVEDVTMNLLHAICYWFMENVGVNTYE